jgi:adenylate kinase
MKKLLVIVGLPGSGKDTQIAGLMDRRALRVIRVGDLVREQAKTDAEVAADLKNGDLADNGLVNELIRGAIEQAPPNSYIVSDGFPRDLEQAIWLDKYLETFGIAMDRVLYIKVDDDVALIRLMKRGREDDSKATIKHRIQVFHQMTDEVITHYRQKGQLVEIDGNGTPQEVVKNIKVGLGW